MDIRKTAWRNAPKYTSLPHTIEFSIIDLLTIPNFREIQECLPFPTNLDLKGQRYWQMTFIFSLEVHLVCFFLRTGGFRWFQENNNGFPGGYRCFHLLLSTMVRDSDQQILKVIIPFCYLKLNKLKFAVATKL